MKTIYLFLTICSVLLFSFQKYCKEIDSNLVDDCMDGTEETSGYTCCFYNGTYKESGFDYHCSEFPKDEVVEHRKEVREKLLAGNYWSQVTNDSEIMSNLEFFFCKSDLRSNYITIGLLVFVTLLFLLF